MDNPEKLATYGTQDKEINKQNHNGICVGHHYAQTNTNNVNKRWAVWFVLYDVVLHDPINNLCTLVLSTMYVHCYTINI